MVDDSALTMDDRVQLVYALDVEPIVFKLMHPDIDHVAMTLDEADHLVALYRQWLVLCLRYPDVGIVPTTDIDQVWHAHILDTAKYEQDCQHVFGFFLHHFPYLGLRGDADRHQLHHQFTQTRRLFEHEFGVPMGADGFSCGPGQHADFPGFCLEGTCEKFTKDFQARERPRPVRAGTNEAER